MGQCDPSPEPVQGGRVGTGGLQQPLGLVLLATVHEEHDADHQGLGIIVRKRRQQGLGLRVEPGPAVILGEGQPGPAVLRVGFDEPLQLLDRAGGVPLSGVEQAPVEDVPERQLGHAGECVELLIQFGTTKMIPEYIN